MLVDDMIITTSGLLTDLHNRIFSEHYILLTELGQCQFFGNQFFIPQGEIKIDSGQFV